MSLQVSGKAGRPRGWACYPGGKRSSGHGAGVTPLGPRRLLGPALRAAASRILAAPGGVRGDPEDTPTP